MYFYGLYLLRFSVTIEVVGFHSYSCNMSSIIITYKNGYFSYFFSCHGHHPNVLHKVRLWGRDNRQIILRTLSLESAGEMRAIKKIPRY